MADYRRILSHLLIRFIRDFSVFSRVIMSELVDGAGREFEDVTVLEYRQSSRPFWTCNRDLTVSLTKLFSRWKQNVRTWEVTDRKNLWVSEFGIKEFCRTLHAQYNATLEIFDSYLIIILFYLTSPYWLWNNYSPCILPFHSLSSIVGYEIRDFVYFVQELKPLCTSLLGWKLCAFIRYKIIRSNIPTSVRERKTRPNVLICLTPACTDTFCVCIPLRVTYVSKYKIMQW